MQTFLLRSEEEKARVLKALILSRDVYKRSWEMSRSKYLPDPTICYEEMSIYPQTITAFKQQQQNVKGTCFHSALTHSNQGHCISAVLWKEPND